MEVQLNPELQARVYRAAKENNSGPAEYVQQLVEYYVDHDVWFREQVKKGLDLCLAKALADCGISNLQQYFQSRIWYNSVPCSACFFSGSEP
jgi:hypothetical protein